MMSVNIGGRVIAVSPQEYDRIMAKRRELADHDRQVSRELRQERLVPSEHRNATFKVTGSNHATSDQVVISDRAAWLADKAKRLGQDFETFKVKPANLSRMNEAFGKLIA